MRPHVSGGTLGKSWRFASSRPRRGRHRSPFAKRGLARSSLSPTRTAAHARSELPACFRGPRQFCRPSRLSFLVGPKRCAVSEFTRQSRSRCWGYTIRWPRDGGASRHRSFWSPAGCSFSRLKFASSSKKSRHRHQRRRERTLLRRAARATLCERWKEGPFALRPRGLPLPQPLLQKATESSQVPARGLATTWRAGRHFRVFAPT